MKKGYHPAVSSNSKLSALIRDLKSIEDLRGELFERIQTCPSRRITRAELRRDLGFTNSALRLLEKSKWLVPEGTGRERRTYSLQTVLRFAIQFPGFVMVPSVRTVRKHVNITTILRETVWRTSSATLLQNSTSQ